MFCNLPRSFNSMKKKYSAKHNEYPKRTDFSDGSAIIENEDGSIIIIEAQTPYIRKSQIIQQNNYGDIFLN